MTDDCFLLQRNSQSPKLGFPGHSIVKNPPTNARDAGSIPGLRRSPRERNGNPLQYSLSWEIPWTKESDRLLSMGLKRVDYDLEMK